MRHTWSNLNMAVPCQGVKCPSAVSGRFFVPFNGSDFGFRSKASNDFGCGVNFFLRASEQAPCASNSSV
jgi:hypothetical protein